MCVDSHVWFASIFYFFREHIGIGEKYVLLGILDKKYLYNTICEPCVCMLFWFPHGFKSCLPQCPLTGLVSRQVIVLLWKADESLNYPQRNNQKEEYFWCFLLSKCFECPVCKPWRMVIFLNNFSLRIVLTRKRAWAGTSSFLCSVQK